MNSKNAHLTVALAATLLACTSAKALEPFKLYDNFGATPLDLARWESPELIRTVKGGALNLMQRTPSLVNDDNSIYISPLSEKLANPTAVTALKAKVTVNALEANVCPTNPHPGTSFAQIWGSFFNIGAPLPASRTGDVIAEIQIDRSSDSADPPGVLAVLGLVAICSTSTCSSANGIGTVALGTVGIGQATTVQMQWDQPGKRFKFSRDAGAFSGAVTYTQTDTSPPGIPEKLLRIAVYVPSCKSGPRIVGLVDASFDNVSVNSSAAP